MTQKIEHQYSSREDTPKVSSSLSKRPTSNKSSNVDKGGDVNKKISSSGRESQVIEYEGEETFRFDRSRILATSCIGLLWVSPISMLWFPFLHRLMNRRFAHLREGSLGYIFTKVILENICLSIPICSGYFAIPSLIEGNDSWHEELMSRMEKNFLSTWLTMSGYWLLTSPINYKFVPVRYQAAVSCLLAGIEGAGVSYLSRKHVSTE